MYQMVMVIFVMLIISSCNGNPLEMDHAAVVNQLVSILNINSTFREGIESSIVCGGHGPSSEDPWSLLDLLNMFDKYATYLPSAPPAGNPFYWYEQLQSLFICHPIWSDHFATMWVHSFVSARGAFLGSSESLAIIEEWLTSPLINMDDFIIPPSGFTSFNDFFARELRQGVRPIANPDDNSLIVSPADSLLMSILENINLDTLLHTKRKETLNVTSLLGSEDLAKTFIGGTAVQIVLRSDHYHWWHAPVSGRVIATRLLGGLYFGHPYGSEGLSEVYSFHRGVIIFEDEDVGQVAIVPIGLCEVGSVLIEIQEDDFVKKGQRVGRFGMGGSTILILFDSNHELEVIPPLNSELLVRDILGKLTRTI